MSDSPANSGGGAATLEEEEKPRLIALVGNPNVGKSCLFNQLTGSRQKVANYPGVTVDARQGLAEDGSQVVDLPGTYGLRPSALDDAVTAEVILGERGEQPDVVVVVLDATNLRRSLYLYSEVADLGRPTVVALNMVDEARRGGLNLPDLAESLAVPVVETVAVTGEGTEELLAAIDRALEPKPTWELPQEPAPGQSRWERVRELEQAGTLAADTESTARYAWVADQLAAHPSKSTRERTEKIDRVLLHPVAGPLLFLILMALVFQSIFSWAEPLMKFIEEVIFKGMQSWANAALPGLIGATATSLVSDGIIAGVGAVIVFLPQIVILFLLIGLLEDSGYMSRAAFLVDRPLRHAGLSGRSFIPLLSSFACAIPGVLATRTIPDRRERWLTVLIAPLMTCSARIPVYVLLIGTFVPNTKVAGFLGLQGLVLFGLYLAGLTLGVTLGLVAGALKKRRTRGKLLPLVVELPPYRKPSMGATWLKLRLRAGDFLKRAGTVIFAVSVALWFLVSFPQRSPLPGETEKQAAAAQLAESYGGRIGHAM
ncbi:MAG TPA: ferrous iron transport protein B, partial [Planctomycetes bacterium]|nr:ferrous iron transport protein B [Planctomycetota bacterium]